MATFAANLAHFEEGGGSRSELLLPASVPRSNAGRSRGGRCFAIWLMFVAACMCVVILLTVLSASPPWLPELLGGHDEASWTDSDLSGFRGSETPLLALEPPPPLTQPRPLELHEVHGAPFTTIVFLLTLLLGCKLMCSEAPDEDESDSLPKAAAPTAASSTGAPPQQQQPPSPQLPPQSQPPPLPPVGAAHAPVA